MTPPLAVWRPDLAVFIRRCLWLSGATLLFFGAFGFYLGIWELLLAAPILIPLYIFLFDDHLRWFEVSRTSWSLTETALINDGPEGRGQIPLADITSVRTHFGWTVTITLKSGLKVQIPYVRRPREIGAQIIAARNALTV